MALLTKAVALLLLCILAPAVSAQVEAAGEQQIKAAFVQNFTRFVEWPAAALPPGETPIVIGIVGENPFGDALATSVEGSRAHGHPIVIASLRWNEVSANCQLLFISASEIAHFSEILAAVSGMPVLTVGDFDSFARRGGMIELRKLGARIGFDVNVGAATDAGLRISSKLLALASTVYGQPAWVRR